MRTVPVRVPYAGPQHRPQMGLVIDQHPIRALSPYGTVRTQRSA